MLLLAGLLGSAACSPGDQEPQATAPAPAVEPASFVGRAVCADCHAEQDRLWQGSHHDRAMQVPRSESVLGDFDGASFDDRGRRYRFFRRDEAFLVEADGAGGQPTEFEIAYTFGVDPLQQYLIAFPDGRYQALDVAWDARPAAEGGQRWFHLQPDARYETGDPMHWTGVAYNWNFMCADCHSTGFVKGYDAASGAYDSSFAEIDVACEACHGPGSAHVDRALAPGVAGSGLTPAQLGLEVGFSRTTEAEWPIDPQTGLAHRVPERVSRTETATCGRCHARRAGISADYRFGRPLTDSYRISLLDRGLYHDDGQILDEVYVYGSFLQSRMYQQGVSCGDCHEPHSLQLYNEGNALCNRCHLAERFDTPEHYHHDVGSPAAACVSCHMPETTYMVVDPRRDHSFRIPRPDLSLRFDTPNACDGCHVSEGARWAADAVAEWFGPERPASYVELLASGRSGGTRRETDLRALAADPDAPPIARGTALAELPVTSQASITAIAQALADEEPLVRAGALMALGSADPATTVRLALPLVSDPDLSVRLEAARLMATIPVQQVSPRQRAGVEAAIAEYRAAQEVNADRAQSHLNLGGLALQRGDMATAEREYATALELEPYFIPNFINLADLYRLAGRDDEGEALLRRAIGIAPEGGDARYALGLLLVRLGRLDDALPELRRATELAPEQPHYVYVHAVAVQTAGDAGGAIALLDEGLARFPADRELLFGAAAFSRDMGDLERAIGYARRLADLDPNDPQSTAFLRDLESRRR